MSALTVFQNKEPSKEKLPLTQLRRNIADMLLMDHRFVKTLPGLDYYMGPAPSQPSNVASVQNLGCFYSSVMAPISSNQWFHWLRKLSQFRCALLPSFFSPVMAQEEDRKAIGGELESEMVILSQQQMDDVFPRSLVPFAGLFQRHSGVWQGSIYSNFL
ncbi:hypothetical protein NPIL_86121 [Nephila pilipes]|uniref:Uncharacterized protein n=1 Tax=Nephila pilipes TaxID=299642 RepID=A0A8X6P3Q1_NEPPI|nr:hypothetical protein NPIL_86121 [Nephila pilipes]